MNGRTGCGARMLHLRRSRADGLPLHHRAWCSDGDPDGRVIATRPYRAGSGSIRRPIEWGIANISSAPRRGRGGQAPGSHRHGHQRTGRMLAVTASGVVSRSCTSLSQGSMAGSRVAQVEGVPCLRPPRPRRRPRQALVLTLPCSPHAPGSMTRRPAESSSASDSSVRRRVSGMR